VTPSVVSDRFSLDLSRLYRSAQVIVAPLLPAAGSAGPSEVPGISTIALAASDAAPETMLIWEILEVGRSLLRPLASCSF